MARRVRSLRQAQGLTQEDLAERAGISISFVSMIERAERSPSYETLLQLAEGLDLHVAELFRDGRPDDARGRHVEPLLEFLRRTRLTRAQVEKLTRIARALFAPDHVLPDGDGRRAIPRAKTCTQPGCARPLLARGLCASHYHASRRKGRQD